MSDLFLRKWKVQIRDLEVSALRCRFDVTKTVKPEPNKAELKIYGLNANQRSEIEKQTPRDVKTEPLQAFLSNPRAPNFLRIEAGYESGTHQIYFGEVLDGHTTIEGPDVITSVSSADGERDAAQRRINIPIGAGTPPSVALRNMLTALGVGEGNLSKFATELDSGKVAKIYESGSALSGSAWDELQAFAHAAQLEISLQDGALMVLNKGKALRETSLKLNSGSGLIGSPGVDAKGIVTFKTFMIPGLIPGVSVVMDAKALKGVYRVEECRYVGDTHGAEWYVESKGKPVK